jgi:chromosome segregation ATPase
MEEVKKKRFRPTLTAYRELEAQVKALNESNDAVQRKYRNQLIASNSMVKEINSLKAKNNFLEQQLTDEYVHRSTYEELMNKYETLEKSNKYLEESRNSLHKELEDERIEHKKCRRNLNELKSRGFFARVFNINK